MIFVRAIAALALISPLFAQYGGPAILARGQSPYGASLSQIDFRPYLSVGATYTAGLNGVSVDVNGTPVNDASYGGYVGFGISGTHSWKRTSLGLNYAGDFSLYAENGYSGLNTQSFMLSIVHRLSRHATLSFGTSAVLYGSNRATPTLPQTIAFDPATTYIPTNDFFDDRTIAVSSQASITIQKSTRVSYSLGGDVFLTRRQSTALYGSSGLGAHGDIQYRLSRRSTIGVGYSYMHFSFTGVHGSTDSHTASISYSRSFSPTTQFSGYGGFSKYENVFVEIVPIDPAIAAVIGISSAQRVSYLSSYAPNFGARLTKVVPRGTVFLSASEGITPGNGLFLTSTSITAGGGYTYTGLRRWSISATADYNRSTSEGNVLGQYGSYSANLSASRQVAPWTHGFLGFSLRKYDSGDFRNYNKWAYSVSLGLTFTPRDIPVRLW